jgi:hypothetical protein
MKVNMLESKNQLSRLVKDALEGEDVVIAGKLKRFRTAIDAAFNPELDDQIARSLKGLA